MGIQNATRVPDAASDGGDVRLPYAISGGEFLELKFS
jgi:hypothetical protein